jgi:prepilin-type N-terminal cleavage/methylation domain-containing protein
MKKGIILSLSKGFTLIELLVAIAIMAVLMAIALPNFLGARERARDAKLKSEMNQLKNAFQMYYNNYQKYPAPIDVAVPGQWPFLGCGAGGTEKCDTTSYVCTNFWFAAGGDGCDSVYMKKPPVPADSTGGLKYYGGGGDSYAICVDKLENTSDPDALASRNQCAGIASGWESSAYCICPD